eukprot:CAMPEP_0175998118 /NCGR_PEP_ID=MMETSP0108-20121206/56558_1 /TAXON_ID=195067 ORGANISM="Goniomonas pacifica, Strain CCMP1869" /NCGR_SAMPLE_ID=MMETSP0108 /ASSEMBLY_ACC=CAM_ASM_000204 /LENGTH=71 /DNA_ID=CAMNT_0017330413 /DNA_START=696 /DNA_END=909 /DNA_ORIENTATION=-
MIMMGLCMSHQLDIGGGVLVTIELKSRHEEDDTDEHNAPPTSVSSETASGMRRAPLIVSYLVEPPLAIPKI